MFPYLEDYLNKQITSLTRNQSGVKIPNSKRPRIKVLKRKLKIMNGNMQVSLKDLTMLFTYADRVN
ncbi:hypothetical protein T10_8421 [Trichinella papuae]|uniref:Uncharacterized protein n=1 Tax=Trichinella papuae TaxID=268474 RepID=A0A0V1N3X3_9BILA|nr:hypothetical protein T10_8421 [Trichinella papuae]